MDKAWRRSTGAWVRLWQKVVGALVLGRQLLGDVVAMRVLVEGLFINGGKGWGVLQATGGGEHGLVLWEGHDQDHKYIS